jgi:uncharacterized protein YjbJ (UPF0337 family)
MLNNNIAGGNWNELKGRIRSAWGRLTDDELETSKGDVTAVTGLIQQKYGSLQEDTRQKLNDWLSGKDKAGNTAADRKLGNTDTSNRRPN